MIKILNIFELLKGFKVFLEVIGIIFKGIQEVVQHCRNKSNKQSNPSATAPESNTPAEE